MHSVLSALLGAAIIAVVLVAHCCTSSRGLTRHQRRSATGRSVSSTRSAIPARQARAAAATPRWTRSRAQDWLERRQAARQRKANRPPREPRTGRAIRTGWRGVKATGRGARWIGTRIPRPRRPQQRARESAVSRHAARAAAPPRRPGLPPRRADLRTTGHSAQPPPASISPTEHHQPRQEGEPLWHTIGRGITPDHATVNNRVANFEPENDGELVQFFIGRSRRPARLRRGDDAVHRAPARARRPRPVVAAGRT